MENLTGKRWGELSQEERDSLMDLFGVAGEIKEGECIINFGPNLSIAGFISENGDYPIATINGSSILYNPNI